MHVSRSLSPRTATIVLTFTCAATANAGLSGTTTTTLPLGSPVAGKKLLLKENTAKPQKRRLLVLLKDAAIDVPNGSANDPVTAGGSLRIRSSAGGFSEDYDLPATGWRYKGKQGKNKGYLFKGAGPIVKIVLKNGKLAKVVGKGAALVQSLAVDPDPVHVALTIGGTTYCASFDGKTKFSAGKKYLAKKPPLASSCAAFETKCGDGILDPGETCPLLEGPSDGLAVDATFDYDGEPGVPEAEIEEEAPGVRVARTRVELQFDPTATVGEVNAVIEALGGEILMMVRGAPLILVRIPDPGSIGALDSLIATAASPKVRLSKGYFTDEDVLPDDFLPIASSDLTLIDNMLTVGAAAAWNAREATTTPPLLVVDDSFGDGAPNADVGATVGAESDFVTGNPINSGHGYHVLGIAAATFDGNGSCLSGMSLLPSVARGCVTGMMPVGLPMRAVDKQANLTVLGEQMRIVFRTSGASRVVLNTSLNGCCQGTCGDLDVAGRAAQQWTLLVRAAGLETRMLHLTSAGNIDITSQSSCKDPADFDSVTNSAFTAAALHPAIPDLFGTGTIPNLSNTLVVENVRNMGSPAFEPWCLSITSKRPGNLSGIGTQVWSHIDAGTNAGNLSGTSMSTPQVAGLAAYLWALDPSLTVAELRSLLVQTSEPVTVGPASIACDPLDTQPQPLIDAYAAVLGTDRALDDAPARRAILDVVDGSGALGTNGRFDERDLERLLSELDNAAGARDWSRFDLNGDGRTGGDGTAFVDLDVNRPPAWTTVDRPDGLGDPYDEQAVTDFDVLCYYANSPLYVGSQDDRATILAGRPCPVLKLSASLAQTITPGTPEPLVVSVIEEDDMGTRPLQGVYVELTATGGNVVPSSGTTDAQGEVTAQVSADPTATVVEVSVRALDGPGGTPLGEQTVTAQVQSDVPGTVSFESGRCTFTLSAGAALSSTVVLNDGGGLGGSTEPMPFADSDTAGGSIGLPGVGSATVDAFAAVDGHFITDAGATLIGVHYSGQATHSSNLVVEDPSNLTPYAGAYGGTACSIGFVVLDGAVPYHIVASASAMGTGSGAEHRAFVALAQANGGPQVFFHENGALDQTGTLLPARYGFTFDARAGAGSPPGGGTAEGMAMLTADLILGTGTPTTTMVVTTTTTSSTPTSTTTSTSTSSSTTSLMPTSTTSTSTSTSTTTTLFAVPVVPYARYVATGPDGPVVMLADEFGTESVDLGAVGFELPPVTIDGLLPPDPETHQTCWTHPGGLLDTCIDVQDRFGLAPLRVGGPVTVCVPDLSPAIAVDAFKCYQATGTPLDQPVALEDEFQTQAVMVGAPELLCTPVEVDGNPITNAGRYLVCYATTPAGAAGGQISVENALSGGPIQVDLGAATGVCVPALRQLVATCQLCGNGVPEGDEECDDGNVVAGDGCSPVCRLEPGP